METNQERLWDSLMEMAKIGAIPKGGSGRVALTHDDKLGRELFIKWCEDENLACKVDKIGNIFATRQGKNPKLLPIMMGSHLDTQPRGGKFDGVYGVLGALEVIRTLNDHQIETKHPIEIAVWTNEEGARFAPAMLGSAVYTGELSLEEALATCDKAGISVKDALEEIGFLGNEPLNRPVDSYFELHIEQGPILELNQKQIGVVTGGQGFYWLEASITGASRHAGTTPMEVRQDPMMAFSELLLNLEKKLSAIPDGLFTIGELYIDNPSHNTSVGHMTFSIDLRNPDLTNLEAMKEMVNSELNRVASKREVEVKLTVKGLTTPTPFDEVCVNLVEQATLKCGYPYLRMISGAGHDAVNMAKHYPAAMIFNPCADGISHNEAESITPEDGKAGADVLLHTILLRDSTLVE